MDLIATFNQIEKEFMEEQEQVYSSEELETEDSALDLPTKEEERKAAYEMDKVKKQDKKQKQKFATLKNNKQEQK